MKEKIDSSNIPEHIAVIMDGNGRWAKKQGAKRIFGHKNALKSVREVVEGSAELGVKYLTLFAFSTENWNRPKAEVIALMELLLQTLRKDSLELAKNNIRLSTIGDLSTLPKECIEEIQNTVDLTKDNDGLTLIFALSYSGRWEIAQAVKNMVADINTGTLTLEEINERNMEGYLTTQGVPDPALLIRTSGEMRISNFLLWQLAYTELYFSPMLWPEFRKQHLLEAILAYQARERRFGKTSEQL